MADIDIFDGYYDEECLCQEQIYGSGDTWIAQDYKHYKINKMQTRHIRNCVRMLRRRLMYHEDDLEPCCYSYIESRIKTLEEELERRKK